MSTTVTKHDDDGDTVALSYQWQRSTDNGATWNDIAGETGSTLNLALAGNGNKGDKIRVKVTPNDGTVDGATVTSAAVTIVNSAPTATVALSDSSPKTNDTLTATATRADADNDAVSLTYVWKVNGTTKQTTITTALTDTFNLATGGNGDKGDTVTVEVTPYDGSTNGAKASASAVVANSAPTATVSLSDHAPKTSDTL